MNDAAGNLAEGATFCLTGDAAANFRPGLVNTIDGVGHQLCPDDVSMGADEVTDANPTNWYARVMFDELLDPTIEDLVPILDENGMDTGTTMGTLKNTQPFTLQCQSVNNGGALVDIPYDGYYSPGGNKITWPVGPSLVVIPNEPSRVATTSECQLTLKDNIKDEDGNPVPMAQRGPYKFKIAPVQAIAADTTPADGDSVDPQTAGVDVTFNTNIDPASFDPTTFVKFTPDPGGVPGLLGGLEAPNEVFVGGDFPANGSFMWEIPAGTMIKDQCGKVTTFPAPSTDAGTSGSFMTNDLMFLGIAPFDMQMNAKPSSKIVLKFNQWMDATSLAANEFSLTTGGTAVTPAAANYDGGGNLIIDAELKPATTYTFTLKSGATIDDCPGLEGPLGGTCMKSATFTNPSDQTVTFTTAALALTSTTPADNATDASTNSTSGHTNVLLTFNFDVDPTTLATTEFAASSGTWTVNSGATSDAGPNQIEIDSATTLPPGDYTFTLKMGATISDTLGDVYTQAADKVIHFSVAPPAPAAPACY